MEKKPTLKKVGTRARYRHKDVSPFDLTFPRGCFGHIDGKVDPRMTKTELMRHAVKSAPKNMVTIDVVHLTEGGDEKPWRAQPKKKEKI